MVGSDLRALASDLTLLALLDLGVPILEPPSRQHPTRVASGTRSAQARPLHTTTLLELRTLPPRRLQRDMPEQVQQLPCPVCCLPKLAQPRTCAQKPCEGTLWLVRLSPARALRVQPRISTCPPRLPQRSHLRRQRAYYYFTICYYYYYYYNNYYY